MPVPPQEPSGSRGALPRECPSPPGPPPCPKGSRSKITCQKLVCSEGSVPTRFEVNAPAHRTPPDLPAGGGRRSELGDGFAMAGDDHLFPALYGTDQFRQPVLGFGDRDIHEEMITRNSSQINPEVSIIDIMES